MTPAVMSVVCRQVLGDLRIKLRTLMLVVLLAAVWMLLAKWHLGWALFSVATLPSFAICVACWKTPATWKRIAYVSAFASSLVLLYPLTLGPVDPVLRLRYGPTHSNERASELWNSWCTPLLIMRGSALGRSYLHSPPLTDYIDVWNRRNGYK